MWQRALRLVLFGAVLLAVLGVFAKNVLATLYTSKASYTGDWADVNTWTNGSAWPGDGDDVQITNAGSVVILSSSSSNLSSITIGKTLTFTNWDTALTATNVTILTNGAMTLPGPFSNNVMSNRVWVVCTNLTIASGGQINADGRGYRNNNGPGAPSVIGPVGGSHGGKGGNTSGNPYGSADAPLYPGSGGYDNQATAHGGGAVRIEAALAVTNNGTISANGNDASSGGNGGGGSGGSVYIICRTFAGTNGIVRANGGNQNGSGSAGGGGRISVVYDTAAQSSEPVPSVTFSALPGSSGVYPGDIGTLYFPDNRFLTETISHSGKWMAPVTNFAVPALTINNASIGFPAAGFLLNVAGNLTITGSVAKLWLGTNTYTGYYYSPGVGIYQNAATTSGPTLRVGGNLIVTNGAQLHIFGGYSNAVMAYGARIVVTGDVFIAGGSRIALYSEHGAGASSLFTLRNLTIAAGGLIDALGKGYRYNTGPGKGTDWWVSSAGYGGGGGYTGAGPTYGYSNAPTLPGSGGGGSSGSEYGSKGGSLVRIEAENVRLDGSIIANGTSAASGNRGGASGGGIFIICNRFEGSGTNTANGGAGIGTTGGGGGGRIAVWFNIRNVGLITQRLTDNPTYTAKQVASLPLFTGTFSVNGGAGSGGSGTNGTIMFIEGPPPGTIFTIH